MVTPTGLLTLAVLVLQTAAAPTDEPPAATQRAGPRRVAFAPGVWIDWSAREVHVQTHVVLRAGALEFLACFAGKEHESILRIEATAVHIYMALGLIGLSPGHPPVPDPQSGRYGPPAGDLVDISLRWDADGRTRTANACDWLRTVVYGRSPLQRPWFFGGSLRQPDDTLAADASGVGIALVDFPDSLLCYSRRFPSRYGALWAEANTTEVPPLDTRVWLVLRAAVQRERKVIVDHCGVIRVDERYCRPADLADLLLLARRLDPGHVETIELRGTLRSDVDALLRKLRACGLPPDAVRVAPAGG